MKCFMVMVLFVSLAWKATVSGQYSSRSSSDYDYDHRTTLTPTVLSPRNLTVFEGSNVTFSCSTPEIQAPGYVSWFQELRSIANCRQGSVPEASDKVERISVYSSGTICMLSIYQVTPMDTSQYYCGFSAMEDDAREEETSGLGSVQSFLNDDVDKGFASLTVLSATLSPPICEVLPSGELNIGDSVSLTCKPPVNSQLSRLAWYDNKTDTALAPQQITKPGSSFVLSRVLSVADNLESFTCIAAGVEEGLFTYMSRPSCSITPLRVIFTVGLTPHTEHVLDQAEALFHCVTKSLFPVDTYHWHILQGNKIQYVSSTCGSCRYKVLDGGKTLAIPEVRIEEDDGLQVKCTAANTHNEEASSHWGLLTVERPNNSSAEAALNSHSHAGSKAAGVFTGLAFFIIVAVFAYYIHKKRILQNRSTSRRTTSSTSGQGVNQALDTGPRYVQNDGCKVESVEIVVEVPKEQQDDYEVPQALPAKGKKIQADQSWGKNKDEYTYDIPRPIKTNDHTYANTGF